MKITGVRTRRINIPFNQPIGTAIHHIEGVAGLLVWVDTDEGITGESYLWVMGVHRLPVLEAMVQSLALARIGKDPRDVGRRDRVRAYASGGLWANRTLEELHDEAKAFLAQGFTAMKVRVGRPDAGEDAERVAAVRSAIGWKVALMADVNQGLSVDDAIRLGRRLEPYGLTWLEEPVQLHDLEGCARVAAEIDIPIASGESEYGRYGFRDMLERKSASILMPDLERVGGVTEFHRVAEMAAAFDIQVSPHLFTEHSLQLCATAPTCLWAEHMPWFRDLFLEPLEMQDGDLLIPDRPGLGFTFDPDAVERFAI